MLCLFALSVFNSAAVATEVNTMMTGVKQEFYIKTNRDALLSFEIYAKQLTEVFNQAEKKSVHFFSKAKLKKVSHYRQGTLYLKDCEINFELAYWSRGQLVLKNASGTLGEYTFNSPEVYFSKFTMQIAANNMMLRNKDKLLRKLNYEQKVLGLSS